jgi:Cdc6-like AAA superfamily ATPase
MDCGIGNEEEGMNENGEKLSRNQEWLTQPEPPSPEESEASTSPSKKRSSNDSGEKNGELEVNGEESSQHEEMTPSSLVTQEEIEPPFAATRKILRFSSPVDENNSNNNNNNSDFPVNNEIESDADDSSDSGSSTFSQESMLLTLSERRLRNDERNAKFLSHLEDKYSNVIPKAIQSRKEKKTDIETNDNNDEEMVDGSADLGPSRGMLFEKPIMLSASSNTGTESLQQRLKQRYPHREQQIRLLSSHVSATIGQVCRKQDLSAGKCTCYVPAPIFVMGGPGGGKTSIVFDVVESFRDEANSSSAQVVTSAYINCATLEPSSIDRLVASAYAQLRPVEGHGRRRKRKRKTKSKMSSHTPPSQPDDSSMPVNNNVEKPLAAVSIETSTGTGAKQQSTDQLDDNGAISINEDPSSRRRTQPSRKAKKEDAAATAANSVQGTEKKTSGSFKPLASQSGTVSAQVDASSHAVVAAFGRALQPSLGSSNKKCGFVILDHADRLLSLSTRKVAFEQTNYLAELLLLPKVMELNLTVIVITNNCILDGSRKFALLSCVSRVSVPLLSLTCLHRKQV